MRGGESVDVQEILQRLKNVQRCGDGWRALCPAHPDTKPSLSVREGADGRILLCCHAGCATERVVAALGLRMADLFPDRHGPKAKTSSRPTRKIVAAYDYTDADGRLLFQVVRFEPKGFAQRRPDPTAPDGWTWNLKGIEPVLYRLPQVLEAVRAGEMVFICEGEKDCDNLAALGLCATTCPMGAGKWQESYAEALAGADVVILPDNDEPGRRHARQVAESLHRRGCTVRVLELSGLPPKGDVSDWLVAGGTKEELLRLAEATPLWEPPQEQKQPPPPQEPEGQTPTREPVLVRLADVEPEEVFWLWEPYIARGKLTTLEGDPGVGKSWLALTLAAIVSRGWPFPSPDGIPRQEQVREPENVLYLSAEDGLADTIRVRLDSAGADAARVYVLTGWTAQTESGDRLDGYVTLQDIPLLEEALARIHPALLVVDPVQGFLGGIDAWRAEQVRPILARIGELAARYGCAVLLIRHLSKSPKDRAIYRGLGSIDFSAAARSVLAVVRKDDERGIVHVKSSLAPEGPSIGFDIRGGQFVWTGLSKLTKADVNAPEASPEDRTQAEECADFLRDLLADGPRPAQEVIRLAARAGYRGGTLDRGKALAGVKARSKRGPGGRLEGWEWFLSPGHQPPLHHGSTPPPIPGGALVSGAANPSAPRVLPDNHQGTNMVLWWGNGETVGPQGFRGQNTRAPQKIGGPPDALDGVVEEGVIE